MCKQCFYPVFDPEDLIDGLCDRCVDKIIQLRIPANDGGEQRQPTMKSVYCGSLGAISAKPVRSKKVA